MKKILTFFIDYRLLLLLTYLLLLQYFFLRGIIAKYQISDRDLYILGNSVSKGLVFIGLLFSLLYPLIIQLQRRYNFKEKLIFVFIGFVPALYHIVLLILTITLN